MAVHTVSTSDALSQQQWAEGLEAEVLKKISYLHYTGTGSDSLIQMRDELVREPGDTVTWGLRMQDSDDLLGSSDTFETNESTFTIYNDSMTLDEIGRPYRWKTRMDRQRVSYEPREEAKTAISDAMANGIDHGFFNQICGFTATSGSADETTGLNVPVASTMSGLNTVLAPSSNYHIFAGSSNSADEDLIEGDDFTLDMIDAAVLKAKTLVPAIRPARVEGFGEKYVVFLHPYQVHQLRASDSRWTEVQEALLRGGFIDKNPLLIGTQGVWNNCVLVENVRVTRGVNSSSGAAMDEVRRAVFCGAQAASLTWGREPGTPGSFIWEEERFDYGRQRGVAASCIFGLKKSRYNSSDFATIVLSSYSDGS